MMLNRHNPVLVGSLRLFTFATFVCLVLWFVFLSRSFWLPTGHNALFGLRSIKVEVVQVAFFAAALATAGWIVNARYGRSNSVKQHTMSLLTQVRLSTEMNRRIANLFDKFPVGVAVSEQDVADGKGDDWYNAASYMLNYFEFIAVARRYGDLHDALLRDCIRSQFLHYCQKRRPFIENARNRDPRVVQGKIKVSRSRIYQDILALQQQWS